MKKFLLLFFSVFYVSLSYCQSTDFIYTQTCYGSQTTLVGSSTLLDSDVQSWQWDIDANGTYDYSGKIINYLFLSGDTFYVKLKVTPNSGSPDSITKIVIIDPLPNVNFHVDNLCAFRQAVYYDQSTISSGVINQYKWDFNNDGIVDDNSGNIVNYTCGPAQTYITKLTCISDKGCSAFTTKTTEVFPQPQASFNYSNTCEGENTIFTNSSTIQQLDFYLWDFGDGEASVAENPMHKYNSAGNYYVSLIAATVNGCRDTTSQISLSINTSPTITITTPNNDSIIHEGEQLMLNANGAQSYVWWNGSTSPNIIVTQEGTYSVTGTDPIGCIGSAIIHITKTSSNDNGFSLVSNILTPNGDNINDKLIINNLQPNFNCTVDVFNLWNDKVYSSNNYNNDWDCKNKNGKILPDGAYYYIIQCNGQELRGTINILTKNQ